jgi:DNA-directed RNA polymerase subunit L
MLVQVSRKDEREFTVEVTGEDYSLAEIVHHELLDEKNVTFAGVLPPHPLIKKLVVKVRAQRIKPEKAFLASLEKAETNTRELLDAVTKAVAKSGGSE